MSNVPILASRNCHPCCWFANEPKCKCSCNGDNHGRLSPANPQAANPQATNGTATTKGRTYQNTLFILVPALKHPKQVLTAPIPPTQDTTDSGLWPIISTCLNCSIPLVIKAQSPASRCPRCARLRSSHRGFVLARQQRLLAAKHQALHFQTAMDLPSHTTTDSNKPTASLFRTPPFLLP